jgi:predicted 3-demethylubiquinone-9 3-methyltransferase (glyoxalase superfamily)
MQAISFMVNCRTQAEVDRFWENLSQGGATNFCGWLSDRFGVPWQIVPTIFGELMEDKDPDKAERVMAALLTMTKFDIDTLQRAAEGA